MSPASFVTPLVDVLNSLGLFGLLVLCYGFLLRAARRRFREPLMGLLFAIGAVVALSTPHEVAPGIIVDARAVVLGLAGPFGGTIAAIISAAAASILRLSIGGAGAHAGVVGICLAAGFGIAFRYLWTRPETGYGVKALFALGVLVSVQTFSVFLLPWEVAYPVFVKVAPALLLVTITGIVLLGMVLSREWERLRNETHLRTAAGSDPLTGLANRRQFDQTAALVLATARRHGRPLAVVSLDCDHFKSINDRFGHDGGDLVLKALADLMRHTVRTEDLAARFGGEEFIILLPDTTEAAATVLAERLREGAERLTVRTPAGPVSLTVSLGVAELGDGQGREHLLAAVDKALYRAKNAGRNRVERASEDPTPPRLESA